jgi:hypothetical protein
MRKLRFALLGAVIAAMLPAAVQAQSRRVTIVNHSGQSLYNFYASNTATNTWPDLMGEDDIIGDGEEKTIDLDDGTSACRFDLRAVFKNGRTVTAKAVDACKLSQWVFDGYGHNELVYDNFKGGAATAEPRPKPSPEPKPSAQAITEYVCSLEGKRIVIQLLTGEKVTMTIDGRPVRVKESREMDPMMESYGYKIETDSDIYELGLPESSQEKPVLERFIPMGLMNGTNPHGDCREG